LRGDRIVLIDPWDAGGYGPEEVDADLKEAGLSWKDVAAVAFTKAPAPDLVSRIRALAPQAEDWGTPVSGTRHDLGQGLVLEVREGFWVAGPSGAAFTGDAFAGLGWVEDETWVEDLDEASGRYFEDEALRWFSSRPLVPEHLPAGVSLIAPAHGCPWRIPEGALARARRFAEWGTGGALDEVTVVWPSGPGYEPGVDALVGGVLDAGAGINLFRVPGDDPTALAAGSRRASLVVVAAGLDQGFLNGLDKDLWCPDPAMSPAELRRLVTEHWNASP
jgi:hypothetical protein